MCVRGWILTLRSLKGAVRHSSSRGTDGSACFGNYLNSCESGTVKVGEAGSVHKGSIQRGGQETEQERCFYVCSKKRSRAALYWANVVYSLLAVPSPSSTSLYFKPS
mmetsp:Transcript_92331/g.183330  ORF Transcript_92331/g.183330 Transcript_92331/m.183330 type:complete len:107 (+) Transcript_92331:454-774(+)